MIAFLRWMRSALLGILSGFGKFALFLILVAVVLLVVGLVRGDGLPGNMVLTLDLRETIDDSSNAPSLGFGERPVTVMDLLFALRDAKRDARVKGLLVRFGDGGISIAEAEEIGAAFADFRSSGKFVIAQATEFSGTNLGDYLTAASADQIWVQPKAPFSVSGPGGAEFFLRGLFDKVQAAPQIAKRAEYKSAADMFMEKDMTAADREQLSAVMQSWYDAGTTAIASARKLTPVAVRAAFEASPQLSEDAKAKGLIDKIGYDDDARKAALERAGSGAKPTRMSDYILAHPDNNGASTAPIAVIEAAGEIRDGTAGGGLFAARSGIASDDLSDAIRRAARDKNVKAIVLRIDSPGGSVSASDQILDALKKAQGAGKKLVVSMAGVAASGGYYVSASADKIVAEPGTLTGSIGVLTGKVSVDKSLALAGIGTAQVGIGKNALMDSSFSPYTEDQWAALNREADEVYDDFLHKVAAGRKLPLAQVQTLARGRVWTGDDASRRGLVDQTGGFWTATSLAAKLAGISPTEVTFKRYPRRKRLWQSIAGLADGTDASFRNLGEVAEFADLPVVQRFLGAARDLPRGGIELKATNLPVR